MPIQQNTVNRRQPRGVVGSALRCLDHNYFGTIINSTPQAKQVATIVVDNQANNQAYTWTIQGLVQSITSDASGTKPEIAAAIAAKINSTPSIGMTVYAVSDGVDKVTITALNPGIGFTVSDSDANLTTTQSVTANAAASDVPMGRMLIVTSNGPEKIGGLPLASLMAAQVDQYLLVYDASVEVKVLIEIDGEKYEATHTMATDAATSAAALAAAINYAMPANTVIASNNTATAVLTSEVPGKGFKSSMTFGPGADTAAYTKSSTENTYGVNIERMLGGVSSYTYGEENTSITDDTVVYPKNSGVKVQIKDDVWVADPGSVTVDAAVYVETASGANTGLMYAAPSASRIRIDKKLVSWIQSSSADSLYAVRLNLPA